MCVSERESGGWGGWGGWRVWGGREGGREGERERETDAFVDTTAAACSQRYSIAERLAPAPHLAHPEGFAALHIVIFGRVRRGVR